MELKKCPVCGNYMIVKLIKISGDTRQKYMCSCGYIELMANPTYGTKTERGSENATD